MKPVIFVALLMFAAVLGSPTVLAAPVVNSFTATPSTISSGGTSTLSWQVSGANTNNGVSIGGGEISTQIVGTSGTISVHPTATTDYILNAISGISNPVTKTVTVTVSGASSITTASGSIAIATNNPAPKVGNRLIFTSTIDGIPMSDVQSFVINWKVYDQSGGLITNDNQQICPKSSISCTTNDANSVYTDSYLPGYIIQYWSTVVRKSDASHPINSDIKSVTMVGTAQGDGTTPASSVTCDPKKDNSRNLIATFNGAYTRGETQRGVSVGDSIPLSVAIYDNAGDGVVSDCELRDVAFVLSGPGFTGNALDGYDPFVFCDDGRARACNLENSPNFDKKGDYRFGIFVRGLLQSSITISVSDTGTTGTSSSSSSTNHCCAIRSGESFKYDIGITSQDECTHSSGVFSTSCTNAQDIACGQYCASGSFGSGDRCNAAAGA